MQSDGGEAFLFDGSIYLKYFIAVITYHLFNQSRSLAQCPSAISVCCPKLLLTTVLPAHLPHTPTIICIHWPTLFSAINSDLKVPTWLVLPLDRSSPTCPLVLSWSHGKHFTWAIWDNALPSSKVGSSGCPCCSELFSLLGLYFRFGSLSKEEITQATSIDNT